METKKGLTGKEKFAYGIGAVGKDMVYMLSASYILYYFQDIMKTSVQRSDNGCGCRENKDQVG